MYITKVEIENIRSLTELKWELPQDKLSGWHVIIGDNGSGKSTFLRAVALALVGPTNAHALRQSWDDWLTRDKNRGHILLELQLDTQLDSFIKGGRIGKGKLAAQLKLERTSNNGNQAEVTLTGDDADSSTAAERHIWGSSSGWFSASYGPFRRFTGGDRESIRLFYSFPRLAAHLSVFGEDIALSEGIQWLQGLHYQTLDKNPTGAILNPLKKFINQEGFLPHSTKLKSISSSGVVFEDGNGYDVSVENLSDGYRSILSMTFELIRQLSAVYGTTDIFETGETGGISVKMPGVVLVDEIDAHLHPTWQRRIGMWFRQHFPHMQFIVTTHSPLVCQAAEVGTVWRLPRPGQDEDLMQVTGDRLNRLLHGNILDAYSTEMFGDSITRSESSKQSLERLAELNQKELFEGLNEAEADEQRTLRAALPTAANASAV